MRKPDFADAMLAVSHVVLAAQDWKRAYESETAPTRHSEDRLREALDDLDKIDTARSVVTVASSASGERRCGQVYTHNPHTWVSVEGNHECDGQRTAPGGPVEDGWRRATRNDHRSADVELRDGPFPGTVYARDKAHDTDCVCEQCVAIDGEATMDAWHANHKTGIYAPDVDCLQCGQVIKKHATCSACGFDNSPLDSKSRDDVSEDGRSVYDIAFSTLRGLGANDDWAEEAAGQLEAEFRDAAVPSAEVDEGAIRQVIESADWTAWDREPLVQAVLAAARPRESA